MTNVLAFIQSDQFVLVRRRIFRQLIESLLYEGMIQVHTPLSETAARLTLAGRGEAGEEVVYCFDAMRKASFERVRLTDEPVVRIVGGREQEADSLSVFLLEIAPLLGTSEANLSRFMHELNQTWLKDAMTQHYRQEQAASLVIDYDELEGDIMDGHPYHPCYKSRIGFSLADHQAFGPEYKPRLHLVWVAIKREEAKQSISQTLTYETFIEQELGADYQHFVDVIEGVGKQVADYVMVPVHPWQWRQVIASEFTEQFRTKSIIYLGEGTDEYRPQQSIRTLANATTPTKAYTKFPVSITNTSTGRTIPQHKIINAARISDWLGNIVASDSFLRDELRLIMLKEIMGISYHHQGLPHIMEQKVYGVLGAIWRESLHNFLDKDEAAVPFNGLTHLDVNNRPLIDPWVQASGVCEWLAELLEVSIVPLIHLLYAYGVAMEAHAQNMVLLVRDGMPVRIALKDFNDGIRYSPKIGSATIGCPQIEYPPANHPRLNRNSFIEKEDLVEIKNALHDAFFFINMSELALFVEKQYDFAEQEFWAMVADVIIRYQAKFPHLQERFEQFDLFSETIEVEQLTKRRLLDEGALWHDLKNPLYAFRSN